MKIYPQDYPAPLIEDYGIDVDMGVSRTLMESGQSRQRRRYNTMPQYFSFTFSVAVAELNSWQRWVDDNAYNWFQMDATSYLSGVKDETCTPHVLRLISDLEIAPITEKYVRVSVLAEQAPPDSLSTPAPLTGDWIIARVPDNPSPDWIIARIPLNPSTDWVIAGTPANPAAHV